MGSNSGFMFQSVREEAVSLMPVSASTMPQILRDGPNMFITRVDWGKRRVSPYHEYLVAYVKERKSDGAKPRKSVVMIEREVGDSVADDEDPNGPPARHPYLRIWKDGKEVPPPKGRFVRDVVYQSSKSISKKPTLVAADKLTFSPDGTDCIIEKQHPSGVCRTLWIEGDHMSLAQLVLLTKVVHDYCRSYRLLDFQCYWFAEVIYITIQTLVKDSVKSSSSGSCRDNKSGSSKLKHGHFASYEATRGEDNTAEEILEQYKAAWSLYQVQMTDSKDVRRTVGRVHCCVFK